MFEAPKVTVIKFAVEDHITAPSKEDMNPPCMEF